MDRRVIFVLNWDWVCTIRDNPHISGKHLCPLGKNPSHLSAGSQVLLRFKESDNSLAFDDEATIEKRGDFFYIKSIRFSQVLQKIKRDFLNLILISEGSPTKNRITIYCDDADLIALLDESFPSLRLSTFDLPPAEFTVVDAPEILKEIYSLLEKTDPVLISRRADRFAKSPHIIASLLTHVLDLKSRDQIDFIPQLRCLSDQLRELLTPWIMPLKKNHLESWANWQGRRVGFLDGGVSRISGLPSAEPLAIRVGVYLVCPGESDMNVREIWDLKPYVVGDVVNDITCIADDYAPAPDRKRLMEAARYLLEPLTALSCLSSDDQPEVLFLHGPLVNSYEMYDEGEPNFIPGVDTKLLADFGISEEKVVSIIEGIPLSPSRTKMWNQCIAIYAFLMKQIFAENTPIIGVVERSASSSFSQAILKKLGEESVVTQSYLETIRNLIKRYRITDEFLLGCILEEGEFIQPLPLPKNITRRARDRWQSVIGQIPIPAATYLKTSASNFPFRVEVNLPSDSENLSSIFSLLYHTSLLLPHYAFPVGLDIVDKYAKIPDWISKGISSALAAHVLSKAVQTGEPRVIKQIRQLLAQSPRDFFFRPRV